MSYLQEILRPNEQIRAEGKLHWIIYVPGIAFLIVALPIAIVSSPIAWICGLLGAFLLIRSLITAWTTEIAVTDTRVIYKTGLIRRSTAEMNMNKVESVTVDQSTFGRLLGYGSIHVRGTGVGLEQLNTVRSPVDLRNSITAGRQI